MALIDAKNISFKFRNFAISKVESYELFTANPRFATFRPLKGKPHSAPLEPDRGTIRLNMICDIPNSGQSLIRDSYVNKKIYFMKIIKIESGSMTEKQIPCFCTQYTETGSDEGATPIIMLTAVFKITDSIN